MLSTVWSKEGGIKMKFEQAVEMFQECIYDLEVDCLECPLHQKTVVLHDEVLPVCDAISALESILYEADLDLEDGVEAVEECESDAPCHEECALYSMEEEGLPNVCEYIQVLQEAFE